MGRFFPFTVFLETFLRWVRTSANFEEVPWLIKIQRASADKVKIGSLTQNLSILGVLIFLTQSVARVQLVLNLRLQNSRERLGQKSQPLFFGLSSKTQWLSGLYYADFISFYSPTQLRGGGTTKSNSNELPISVPLSLFSRRKVSRLSWIIS